MKGSELGDECVVFSFNDISVSLPQVQHALKKSEGALQTLNRAIAADPKNPLCKFHRASILFANDRHNVSRFERYLHVTLCNKRTVVQLCIVFL